jgi:hypothetical protein
MKPSTLDLGGYPVPYLSVFEDALPTEFMKKLIVKFDENEGSFQKVTVGNESVKRRFTEINISQHWHEQHELFVTYVQEAWKVYMALNRVEFDIQWPRQFGYEQFRIKKYYPNGTDEFGLHTDVSSYAGSRRFLAFLWYLNTPEQGGETYFYHLAQRAVTKIPAATGRMIMFPPLWTHPHQGAKVLGGPKFIVSGYLHYI